MVDINPTRINNHLKCQWSTTAIKIQFKNPCDSIAGDRDLILGWGTKITHAAHPSQKIEKQLIIEFYNM